MSPRRAFGPVVLTGLVAGLVAAATANRSSEPVGPLVAPVADDGLPLVTALALVALATWGVLLFTRRRVRRAMALLGAVASAGALVATVTGWSDLADGVARAGALGGSALSLAATLLAVRLVPHWPEMGTRYDAPAASPDPPGDPNLELWKALDEGRDPTL